MTSPDSRIEGQEPHYGVRFWAKNLAYPAVFGLLVAWAWSVESLDSYSTSDHILYGALVWGIGFLLGCFLLLGLLGVSLAWISIETFLDKLLAPLEEFFEGLAILVVTIFVFGGILGLLMFGWSFL